MVKIINTAVWKFLRVNNKSSHYQEKIFSISFMLYWYETMYSFHDVCKSNHYDMSIISQWNWKKQNWKKRNYTREWVTVNSPVGNYGSVL